MNKTTATTTCTCGEHDNHVVRRCRTADDAGLAIWSDGAITLTFGHSVKGLPLRSAKSAQQTQLRRDAARLFAGEVCLYSLEECADLYKAALAVAKRGGLPGDVRAEFARIVEPTIRFAWTTLEADNRGDWVVQCTRLDRLRWPGVAIWRTRSHYEVVHAIRGSHGESYSTTGLKFTDQRAITKHLFSLLKH
jgi:hypothetical protein